MITGAAQANCGILVIDCISGSFERGWRGYHGTTKEHAILARSLGVNQLIVAMNKLEMVDYAKERFDEIYNELCPYLKGVGFKEQDLIFVPVSGLLGQNMCEKATDSRLKSWWTPDKPSLIEILDNLRLPQRTFTKPLRVTISDYISKTSGPLIGDAVSAKVEAGILIEKSDLLIMPFNQIVTVKGILSKDRSV